jgi:hypothetical protein
MDQVGWSAKTDEVWVELTQPPLEHLGSVAMGVDVTKRTMTFSAFVGGNERRADARSAIVVGHTSSQLVKPKKRAVTLSGASRAR